MPEKSRRPANSSQANELKQAVGSAIATLRSELGIVGGAQALFSPSATVMASVAVGLWNGVFGDSSEEETTQGSETPEASQDPHEQGRLAAIEVEEKLSRSLTDWVVSDADAMDVLAIYAGLDDAALTAAVAFANQTTIACLMDNMPEEGRSAPGFEKLASKLSITQLMVSKDALSDSIFFADEEEATSNALVSSMLTTADETGGAIRTMDILSTFPDAATLSSEQQAQLSNIFHTADDRGVWEKAFEVRFGVDINETSRTMRARLGERVEDWTRESLTRVWEVLAALPTSHVAGNTDLVSLVRIETTKRDDHREAGGNAGTGGWYCGTHNTVGMHVGDDLDRENNADDGDPLNGVTRFDKVVRHEIGHAVDAQLNFMSSRGSEEKFGGWEAHGNDWMTILDVAMAAFGCPAEDAGSLVPPMEQIEEGLEKATLSRNWEHFTDEIFDTELMSHPLVEGLKSGIEGSPWYAGHLGMKIEDKIYVLSYRNNWHSFVAKTHAQKVSTYQFRAPGEWFAEAYAAYYDPASNGEGALLGRVNSAAKRDFDSTVHPIQPQSTTAPSQGSD
jgi:hypothetical protein